MHKLVVFIFISSNIFLTYFKVYIYRLQDTSKATQARKDNVSQHHFGSGRYMKIHSWLVSGSKWNFVSNCLYKITNKQYIQYWWYYGKKMHGIEFNLMPIEEDKQFGFK